MVSLACLRGEEICERKGSIGGDQVYEGVRYGKGECGDGRMGEFVCKWESLYVSMYVCV